MLPLSWRNSVHYQIVSTHYLIVMHNTLQTCISICWFIKCYDLFPFTCVFVCGFRFAIFLHYDSGCYGCMFRLFLVACCTTRGWHPLSLMSPSPTCGCYHNCPCVELFSFGDTTSHQLMEFPRIRVWSHQHRLIIYLQYHSRIGR